MNTQSVLDRSSISLSVVCAVHCLALPVITVMVPALIGSVFAEESFHRWLAFMVLPLSLVALLMGCKHHMRIGVVILGLSGLLVLIVTAAFGHDLFGELGEKIVTVTGASLIAVAHYRNYKLCQKHHNCQSSN